MFSFVKKLCILYFIHHDVRFCFFLFFLFLLSCLTTKHVGITRSIRNARAFMRRHEATIITHHLCTHWSCPWRFPFILNVVLYLWSVSRYVLESRSMIQQRVVTVKIHLQVESLWEIDWCKRCRLAILQFPEPNPTNDPSIQQTRAYRKRLLDDGILSHSEIGNKRLTSLYCTRSKLGWTYHSCWRCFFSSYQRFLVYPKN